MPRLLLSVSMLIVSALMLPSGASGLVAAQPASSSAPQIFNVDKVHSSVLFRIDHLGASYFHGRFNELKGHFTADPGQAASLTVELEVRSESVDTNNADRDKHLRSADFFNVKEHPSITFKSTSSKRLSSDRYQVSGDLALLGVTKPVTVDIEMRGPIEAGKMGTRSGIETSFTIKRSDYGMNFMQGPGQLGDEVRLTVSAEGVLDRK